MTKKYFENQLSFTDIISKTWNIFASKALIIFQVVFIVYFPINILVLYMTSNATSPSMEMGIDLEAMIKAWQQAGEAARINMFLSVFFGIIATLCIINIVVSTLNKTELELKDAFSLSIKKYPAALGTSVLVSISLVGLFLLLIIPGIIFAVYWQFALIAVVIANKNGLSALKYSKNLVKEKWWKIFLYDLGLMICLIIISIIIGFGTEAISAILPTSLVLNAFTQTLQDFGLAFITVAQTILFLSLDQNTSQTT